MAFNSSNFDLRNWKLTLPIDVYGGSEGTASQVKSLVGYEHQDYFYAGADNSMVFRALVDGATTPGSTKARTELREMSNGTEYNWHPSQGGVMTATLSVNATPTLFDGSSAKVVVGQIHGDSAELVRLYYDSGRIYFINDQAGPNNSVMRFDLRNAKGETANVDLGEKFSYKIEVVSGRLIVTAFADGEVYSASTVVNAVWNNDNLYFKAGLYLGVNEGVAVGAGEVAFYGLDMSHRAGGGVGGLVDISLPTSSVTLNGSLGDDVLRGSALNDVLNGGDGADILNGNGGDDVLSGEGGADRLNGGTGADRMLGGNGDDVYVVDNLGDVIVEAYNAGAGGADTVYSSISYRLTQNVEALVLVGQDDISAFGNGSANTLIGNDGDNVLDGAGSDDIMRGGRGNDTYYVSTRGDVVIELQGGGRDTVVSSTSYVLGANLENLTLAGGAANATGNDLNNILLGNSQNNVLRGNAGNDFLDGGAGADRLLGGSGDDTYVVDSGQDITIEAVGQGRDTVRASVSITLGANIERLVLVGDGALSGRGNMLANEIVGNAAANTIAGGLGADTLTGGGGPDRFVFDTSIAGGRNVDVITDFKTRWDSISLGHEIFGALRGGALSASEFIVGSRAETAEHHIVYDQGSGYLYYDQDGVGGVGQVAFARLTPMAALAAADFLIV